MTRAIGLAVAVTMAALFPLTACFGLAREATEGEWPKSWPQELEGLRKQSRTISIASGIQEEIYEIGFSDRETFERLWPIFLALKSNGGTITLYRTGKTMPQKWSSFFSNEKPVVRIYAPARGLSGGPDPAVAESMKKSREESIEKYKETIEGYISQGKLLRTEGPFPESILSEKCEMPEYVTARNIEGQMTWVPLDPDDKNVGFHSRARIDLEVVEDGKIIDLTKIQLPTCTSIIDKRQ
jgi:hypothetical protein